MLSPHLGVDVHDEGVSIRVRHCVLVVPLAMAHEFAAEIAAKARAVADAYSSSVATKALPEAAVVDAEGKPTKITL